MKISTPEAMHDFAQSVYDSGHTKLLLQWELAAGKTTFVQWYARALWIDSSMVHSPTYAYMDIYTSDTTTLLHIDMYRMEEEQQLMRMGILEAIHDHDYVVIERPKREEHYTDQSRQRIQFEKNGDERIVTQSDLTL